MDAVLSGSQALAIEPLRPGSSARGGANVAAREAGAVRVLIAGGGTGGHVFPALAVAEEVLRRGSAGVVRFVGTARGMEARVLPGLGHDLDLVDVVRLKGAGPAELIRGLLKLPSALLQAWRVVRRFRPDVVVGVGGYASGPVTLVAALSGRPTLVLEQNAVAGFTNRILARFVDRVALTFAAAGAGLPAHKVAVLGNPVRRSIRQGLEDVAEVRRVASADAERPLRLLVFGGSRGARALNDALPDVVAQVAAAGVAVEVRHQTGADDEVRVRDAYAALGIGSADVTPFIHDMAGAYAWCDLAVCRAGASTVCELAVAGVPSVLVPFPFAADDHQAANARALAEPGGALVVRQEDLDPASLGAQIAALARDRERLAGMGDAARRVARPAAAEAVVDELEALAAAGRGRRGGGR